MFTQGKELVCLIPPWKSSVYTGQGVGLLNSSMEVECLHRVRSWSALIPPWK